MPKVKKITQNINKDAGLLDLPKVVPQSSLWDNRHCNYITSNIGDIVPVYIEEVMPGQKSRVTMGMISHMTTPIAPIFNAQYTEFRAFYVPHRLSSDLLAGYKTRKSPWVKVFGEDNASASSQTIVPLNDQKLPVVSDAFAQRVCNISKKAFGGLLDALDYEDIGVGNGSISGTPRHTWYKGINYLSMASYELIYQKAYRNQNREAATNSDLYRFLFDAYNSTNNSLTFNDSFHVAQREKDYFTGCSPFTQKGDPVSAGLVGKADVVIDASDGTIGSAGLNSGTTMALSNKDAFSSTNDVSNSNVDVFVDSTHFVNGAKLVALLNTADGVDIETLRLMIKTQELLEKDMMWGSDYASSLNAHFGTAPISLVLDEPLELKRVTITSEMQAIFQTSTTTGEPSILGSIGANATTQSKEFEIVPRTEFKEWGYLIICACHKAQNSYDAHYFKPKHIFKSKRFDFYTPELDDLGYQAVSGKEFNYGINGNIPVGYNEAWAEYRYNFNKVHGMFEPSRTGAYDFWTLAMSNYNDVQSLYKQGVTELDRAISSTSSVIPQFFDAYGFNDEYKKPMKLHSIPGMDGVI